MRCANHQFRGIKLVREKDSDFFLSTEKLEVQNLAVWFEAES